MKVDIGEAKNWFLVGFVGAMFGLGIASLASTPPIHAPAPHKYVKHVWTKADSLAYAHDQVEVFAQKQFSCLSNLWGKESAWDSKAHNPTRVQGKTAGGIPQLLGMSPLTSPVSQVDRGLSYIYYRYFTACRAWDFWKKHGYY